MNTREKLRMVVVSGVAAGATLEAIEAGPKIVGRSDQCDLVLRDPSVSRRHLEVRLVAGSLRVRNAPGAAPFRFRGALEIEASLAVGDEILLGDTRLRVDPGVGLAAFAPTAAVSHDAVTLLGGRLTEIHGFAAVFALSESLERCDSLDAFKTTVACWASRYIPARETTFRFADVEDAGAAQLRAMRVDVRASDDGTRVEVTAVGREHASCTLEFGLAARADEVSDPLRRLLIISARLCSLALGRVHSIEKMQRENGVLRDLALGSARAFLGNSAAAQRVSRLIPKLAASDASVLILGETGTGKSFVARLIHESSARASEPFRVLNCAALPESLIETELFGHEKGAFTGATTARAGAFESAGRGTLFLDEIGELPLTSQAKLLRAIEERQFERLGSNRTSTMQARVIAATNRDLAACCKEGRFRTDLLYRLSVVTLDVPPLRERRDDLVLLANHLLRDLAANTARRVLGFSPAAIDALLAYAWPGNVRELRNAIERALVLGEEPFIGDDELPSDVLGPPRSSGAGTVLDARIVELPASLASIERRAIEAALRAAGGNMKRAAAILGIARTTLYNKVAALTEDPPDGGERADGGVALARRAETSKT